MASFVTGNAALESFNAGMDRGEQRRKSELEQERRMIDNVVSRTTMPDEIAYSRDRSRLATVQADKASAQYEAESPYYGDIARNQASQSGSNARLAGIRANNASMERGDRGFRESLEAYKQGRFAEGDAILARYGEPPLPEELKRDTATIWQIGEFAEEADRLYPKRPADQQTFIQQKLLSMGESGDAGRPNYADPAYRYQGGEDLPAPSQQGTGDKTYKFHAVYDAAKSLGYSDEEAFRVANGEKPMRDIDLLKMADDLVGTEFSNSFGATPDQRRERRDEVLQELRRDYGPGAGRTQQAPQRQGPSLNGSGTQRDPYVIQSQEDVDWVRQNAPTGAVIQLPDGTMRVKQ